MIVWLNGAFGVGKTTTARALIDLVPNSCLSDPERIGYVMRRTLWRGVDYQDVALWRHLTRAQTARASRHAVAVVPMTVTDRAVFDEVTCGARVFLLIASRSTIERRIELGSTAQTWRSSQLDRCLEAFAGGGLGEVIDTDGRDPNAIARAIASRL